MRTFLGLLMVLLVSGEEETVTGILDGSVLLPCNCSKRNLNKEFKWQKDEPNLTLVLRHIKGSTNFSEAYEDRATIFLSENSNNCSILLTNITAEDQGKYRCKFFIEDVHKKLFVNLKVSASYEVCQWNSTSNLNNNLSVKVFQCDAKGRYGEAEIQWILDGQPLTNSSTTRITHIKTLDSTTGLYSFTSNITTNLTGISCNVTAKDISTINTYVCGAGDGKFEGHSVTLKPEDSMRSRYLAIIPIMLVLGFTLVLWLSWKFSQSSPKKRDVEAGNL